VTRPPAKTASKSPAKPSSGSNGSSAAAPSAKSGSKVAKATKSTKGKGAKSSTRAPVETGPEGHEDYPTWTLPQLRGHFRSLSLEDVKALLTWETRHLDRPPYVTMLSNRIASITGR
jgi:hypothetical protein